MLLCGHTLLVLRFPQVFFPQTWARKDFAHWRSPFWTTPPALFFPEFEFRTTCVLGIFMVCPAEAFNLVCPAFHRIDFFGSEFWDTQPWTLFVSESQLLLLAWFLLTISMSIQATIDINASVSRLVITTHGRILKITRRSFTSLLPIDKGFYLALVARLASRLV